MNFYKHHLGDYDGHTAHLSWDEDMAYTRLIRAYYRREAGIPDAEKYRLTRAQGRAQRAAVDTVLAEFFSLEEGVWRQKRCDEEIAQYQAQASTNRRIARQRIVVRTVNESLTNRVPAYSEKREPNQNQIPEPEKTSLRNTESQGGTARGTMAKALRDEGVEITPGNPFLIQWIERGVSISQVIEAVNRARLKKPKPQQIPAAYLDPIVADVASNKQPTTRVAVEACEWWQTEAGIAAKAKELGIPINGDMLVARCKIAAKIGLGPWIDQRNRTEMRVYEQEVGA